MDKSAQGVGESLASLVLRARLIVRRSSGGVGGPRVHSSRIASTSAASTSAMAAGDGRGAVGGGSDGSSVVGMARALLTGAARGFAHAVETGSSLSLVSCMVVMNFSRLKKPQNVSRALQNVDILTSRLLTRLSYCFQH